MGLIPYWFYLPLNNKSGSSGHIDQIKGESIIIVLEHNKIIWKVFISGNIYSFKVLITCDP